MKKNKIAAAFKNNINYIPKIKTHSIGDVVLKGEDVRMVMNTNVFIGEHIVAFTNDGKHFDEVAARSIMLYNIRPELIGGYGIGQIGKNVVFENFEHRLTIEEKENYIKKFNEM